MKNSQSTRSGKDLVRACTELYDSLISKAGARNCLNEIIRATYRNAPIQVAPTDQPKLENVVNKIVTVSHSYVKFMSNQPEVRVPLPYNMNDIDARHRSLVLEMILNEWYKDINFTFKYNWMVKNLSLFGYQPVRLIIDPKLPTKINMVLDPLDTTVGRYLWGYEPLLDFYGTVLTMRGDQIHERWLDGQKEILPVKRKPTEKKTIKNSPNEEYKILIALTEEDYIVICRDTNELLAHIKHGRGFVPALIWQNFPQPDAVEGVSDVAHIIGKNMFINTILMYAIDYLDYQTNPILFGRNLPAGTNMADIRNSKCGGVNADDPNASMEFIKYPIMSNEFAEILMRLDQAVQDESNVSELATRAATDLRRIDSGTTVASLNMGLEAYLHLKRTQFSTYAKLMNKMYLQWIDEVYRPELFGDAAMIVTGSPMRDSQFKFSGADINGAYDSDVVFIEGQFDMIGRSQLLLQQVQAGLISKKLFRSMTRVPRPESEEEQIRLEQMEQIRHEAMLEQARQGIMPQQQPAPAMQAPQMPQGQANAQQGMLPSPSNVNVPPLPVDQSFLPQYQQVTIEEVAARLSQVKGLKGVAEVMNVVATEDGTPRIIIAITNNDDKQEILKQMPEYRGMIEFVYYPDLEELTNAQASMQQFVPPGFAGAEEMPLAESPAGMALPPEAGGGMSGMPAETMLNMM